MQDNQAVISMSQTDHRALRRTAIRIGLGFLWPPTFAVFVLIDPLEMFGEPGALQVVLIAAMLLGPVVLSFNLRRLFLPALEGPTLVAGADAADGLLLTQRQGRGRGASVLVPTGARVTITPVRIPAKANAPELYGVQIDVAGETTTFDVQMQLPWVRDLSIDLERFARRGIIASREDLETSRSE